MRANILIIISLFFSSLVKSQDIEKIDFELINNAISILHKNYITESDSLIFDRFDWQKKRWSGQLCYILSFEYSPKHPIDTFFLLGFVLKFNENKLLCEVVKEQSGSYYIDGEYHTITSSSLLFHDDENEGSCEN